MKLAISKQPLSVEATTQLIALIDEIGQGAAATRIGVSPHTVRVACAGGAIMAGSRSLIEAGLAREAKAAAAAERGA
jgi:hypothetical protein